MGLRWTGCLQTSTLRAATLEQALARYQLLFDAGQRDGVICSNGATAAVRLGRAEQGRSFADCAVAQAPQSAQAWNARAVIADLMEDWTTADSSYAKARALSADAPDVLNNQGWSMLLRGRWTDALPLLQQAASLEPDQQRVRNNLELAKVAISIRLPERASGNGKCVGNAPQRCWRRCASNRRPHSRLRCFHPSHCRPPNLVRAPGITFSWPRNEPRRFGADLAPCHPGFATLPSGGRGRVATEDLELYMHDGSGRRRSCCNIARARTWRVAKPRRLHCNSCLGHGCFQCGAARRRRR